MGSLLSSIAPSLEITLPSIETQPKALRHRAVRIRWIGGVGWMSKLGPTAYAVRGSKARQLTLYGSGGPTAYAVRLTGPGS